MVETNFSFPYLTALLSKFTLCEKRGCHYLYTFQHVASKGSSILTIAQFKILKTYEYQWVHLNTLWIHVPESYTNKQTYRYIQRGSCWWKILRTWMDRHEVVWVVYQNQSPYINLYQSSPCDSWLRAGSLSLYLSIAMVPRSQLWRNILEVIVRRFSSINSTRSERSFVDWRERVRKLYFPLTTPYHLSERRHW